MTDKEIIENVKEEEESEASIKSKTPVKVIDEAHQLLRHQFLKKHSPLRNFEK